LTEIHQFVATLAERDATGNHTFAMQRVLRDLGFTSEIWAQHASPEVAKRCHPYASFVPGGGPTWLLYQASTGSPVADWLLARPEPKLVYHHNHTTPSFWAPWEPHVAAELDLAWRQTAELAGATRLAMTHSAFTQSELVRVGYRSTAVVPLLFDPTSFAVEPDPRAEERLRVDRGAVWLFVSRLAPHKRQHALIKALALYRRAYDPDARLRLVGSAGSARYLDAVLKYRAELGLEEAVTIEGSVTDGEMSAHFSTADVYVSASEHEGFGIGLIDAMHHGLPVVAVGAAAVPETVGAAAVCVPPAQPAVMAAAVHRVVSDPALRAALVAAGHRRVADFSYDKVRQRLVDVLLPVVQP
jgi:glycosyltransferase involved in cell wall biosynthesis